MGLRNPNKQTNKQTSCVGRFREEPEEEDPEEEDPPRSTLIERNPPPGGFPIYFVPSSRTVWKRTPSKDLYQVLRGGPSYTRFWWGNIVNRKPPWGGGVLSDPSNSFGSLRFLCFRDVYPPPTTTTGLFCCTFCFLVGKFVSLGHFTTLLKLSKY